MAILCGSALMIASKDSNGNILVTDKITCIKTFVVTFPIKRKQHSKQYKLNVRYSGEKNYIIDDALLPELCSHQN